MDGSTKGSGKQDYKMVLVDIAIKKGFGEKVLGPKARELTEVK